MENERYKVNAVVEKGVNVSALLFLLVVTVAIWFIIDCAPLMLDDYIYSSYMSEKGGIPGRSNNSLIDVFYSCWNHYYIANGRLANGTMFLLQFLFGKQIYSIVVALLVVLACWAVSCCFMGETSVFSLSFSIVVSFFFLPALYDTVVWYSGALNYLWGACILIYAIFFLSCGINAHRWSYIFGLILLFLAAAWHEMQGAILVGTVCIQVFFSFVRKCSLPAWWKTVLIVLVAGACIPMLSPAIHERAGHTDYLSFKFVALSTAMMVKNAAIPTCGFVFLLIYHTRKRNYNILYTAACVSMLLAWLMGSQTYTGRSYFYFAVAVLLWFLYTVYPWVKKNSFIKYISITICIMIICGSCLFSYHVGKNVSRVFGQEITDNVVVVDINPINETEALAYICALPTTSTYLYSYVGKYHGVTDFYAVMRKVKGVVSGYERMHGFPTDKPIAKRMPDGWCYIRFPENKSCCLFSGLELDSKTKIRVGVHAFTEFAHGGWFAMMYDRYVAKQKFIYGGLDYYQGHIYALIPPVKENYTSVKCELHDMRTGAKEICIIEVN